MTSFLLAPIFFHVVLVIAHHYILKCRKKKTHIFYKNLNGFQSGLKAYNTYVWQLSEPDPSTLRHQSRSVQEVVHGLQPLLFNCPVFFKAQLAACLQRIFLCIFCIVYYHFCQICFCILDE